MTARGERAVRRADPGAAADRRDIVAGSSPSPSDDLPAEPKRRDRKPLSSGLSLPPDRPRLPLDISAGLESSSLETAPAAGIDFRSTLYLFHELGGDPGAYGALLGFYFCGPDTVHGVRRRLGLGQQAVTGVIAVLLRLRLIEAEPNRPFPYVRRRSYRLTVRGRALLDTPMSSWSALVRQWGCV